MNNYITLGFLPRSGSTKLARFLSTDPQLCVVPNSSSHIYVEEMESAFTNNLVNEKTLYKALNDFIIGLSGAKEGQTIIDKNRRWFIRSKLLKSINQSRKHILIVRDIRYCIASWEEVFRKGNTHRAYDKCFPVGFEELSLSQRIDVYLEKDNYNLGFWLNHLCDTIENESNALENNEVMVVRFEDLISDFDTWIEKIYKFIGVENKSLSVNQYSEELTKDSFHHYQSHIHQGTDIKFVNKQENLADYFNPKVSNYIINRASIFYNKFYPEILNGEQ